MNTEKGFNSCRRNTGLLFVLCFVGGLFSACGGASKTKDSGGELSTDAGAFSADVSEGRISIIGGDAQAVQIYQALPERLRVRISHPDSGAGIPRQALRFTVLEGTATLSNPDATTGDDGEASTGMTLGSVPAIVKVEARWLPDPDRSPERSVVFSVHAFPAPPDSITVVEGDGQCAMEGTPFADPVVMEIRNAYGDLLPGILVQIRISSPAANHETVTEVTSDLAGRIAIPLGNAPRLDYWLREAEVVVEATIDVGYLLKQSTLVLVSQDIFLEAARFLRVIAHGPCGSRIPNQWLIVTECNDISHPQCQDTGSYYTNNDGFVDIPGWPAGCLPEVCWWGYVRAGGRTSNIIGF